MIKSYLLIGWMLFSQLVMAQQTGSLEETDEAEEIVFERGSRIIFSDDFEVDAVGDFPAKWRTDKSGDVKKLKGFANKFLKVGDGSVVSIQLTKALPVHFTTEFDLVMPGDIPMRFASFGFGATAKKIDWQLSPRDGIAFLLHTNNNGRGEGLRFGTQKFSNKDYTLKKAEYKAPTNQVIKIAVAVNDKRIRLYIDGKKMVDMPNGFDPTFRKNIYFNATTHGAADSKLNYFYISNVVVAEAGTDRRSTVLKDLMEQGSFSTNAIQFATNSDKLTATSNDIIQELAEALKENSSLRLKIVGHTDSDGDAAQNILLSKKRAAAVKAKLVSMGIATDRLQTDGKGESEPVADNGTAAGKAENRRVQFIKL